MNLHKHWDLLSHSFLGVSYLLYFPVWFVCSSFPQRAVGDAELRVVLGAQQSSIWDRFWGPKGSRAAQEELPSPHWKTRVQENRNFFALLTTCNSTGSQGGGWKQGINLGAGGDPGKAGKVRGWRCCDILANPALYPGGWNCSLARQNLHHPTAASSMEGGQRFSGSVDSHSWPTKCFGGIWAGKWFLCMLATGFLIGSLPRMAGMVFIL